MVGADVASARAGLVNGSAPINGNRTTETSEGRDTLPVSAGGGKETPCAWTT